MTRWFEAALSALEEEETAAMITVADVSGSAPREAGTHMIVSKNKQWGTIGGGELEYRAVACARDMLTTGSLECQVDDYPLGPELGQCCGGYVRLLTTRLSRSDRSWLEELNAVVSEGKRARFEMTLDDRRHVRHSVSAENVPPSETFQSSIGDRENTKDSTECISEIVEPSLASVYMFGAGHVGTAVARALGPLPIRLVWVDSRENHMPTNVPENANFRLTEELLAQVAGAPADALFLVFTHSHDLDYDVVKAVLQREDYRYCGLIGSRTKRASFERRLREEGLTEESIGRLICPIGMRSLKSKDPNIIAVGVAAELLTYIEARGGVR